MNLLTTDPDNIFRDESRARHGEHRWTELFRPTVRIVNAKLLNL